MKIHFLASAKLAAQRAVQQLIDRYGQHRIEEASHVVAVGGDGTALSALYATLSLADRPVFAMRLPESVGALGNDFHLSDLPKRLERARAISIRPLKAEATRMTGEVVTVIGINEIVVIRQRLQAAKLTVRFGLELCRSIVGDGLVVATPIGSTGYNRSAGGVTLPLSSRLVALTGVAVRPGADWSNTVLSDQEVIDVEAIDPKNRPVRVETSSQDVVEISHVRISSSCNHVLTILLDEQQISDFLKVSSSR